MFQDESLDIIHIVLDSSCRSRKVEGRERERGKFRESRGGGSEENAVGGAVLSLWAFLMYLEIVGLSKRVEVKCRGEKKEGKKEFRFFTDFELASLPPASPLSRSSHLNASTQRIAKCATVLNCPRTASNISQDQAAKRKGMQ